MLQPLLLTCAPLLGTGVEVLSLDSSGQPASTDAFLRGGGGRVASDDGRWVVFESAAADLAPGDANDVGDVYLRDRELGETRRLSNRSDGAAGNGHSGGAVISADGSTVAFVSRATDLVADGAPGGYQVYVWRRADDSIARVSTARLGGPATGDSFFPAVSGDGARVAFWSSAPDLVANDANGRGDVFVALVQSGVVRRVNVRASGESPQGALPSLDLSADGARVAFVSDDPELAGRASLAAPQVFVRDLATGVTTLASVDALEGGGAPATALCTQVSLDASGRVVTFETGAALVALDQDARTDVYARDVALSRTTLVSADEAGAPIGGFGARVSSTGRFVVFSSRLGTLPDPAQLYLRDRALERTEWRSAVGGNPADGDCLFADVAPDGAELFVYSAGDLLAPAGGPGGDVLALARTAPASWILCMGDGSGAIDCPCGNRGGTAEGCANSSGLGARLSRVAGAPGLRLLYEQRFPGGTALLLEGEPYSDPLPFQNGLYCAGTVSTTVGLLHPVTGVARWDLPLPAPGTTRDYQVYYRDAAGPCDAPGNLSNGLRISAL